MPVLMGVLIWGSYFWHAQNVEPYATRLPQGAMVGYGLTCEQVVSLVKQTVVEQSVPLGESVPVVSLEDVTVKVVEVLPDASAVVNIGVTTNADSTLASWMPNGGQVVTETTMRLENVTVSTSVCS